MEPKKYRRFSLKERTTIEILLKEGRKTAYIVNQVKQIVGELMRTALPLDVPVVVEMNTGETGWRHIKNFSKKTGEGNIPTPVLVLNRSIYNFSKFTGILN